jgi:outer membrane protein OmpU
MKAADVSSVSSSSFTPAAPSSMRRLAMTALVSFAAVVGASNGAMAQFTTTDKLLPDSRSNPVVPQPGQVLVRLGGHANFYGGYVSDSGNTAPGYKQSQYMFGTYVHLNPSVDGLAANGLKYGVFVDLWQERPSPAGGGSGGGISPADRVRGNIYVRREWQYIGTDTLGTIRVGTGDPPAGLYQTGTFENFNDGGFNGDAPSMLSGNAAPTWPFALVGNLYTPSRITYLSPQFSGFEFAGSYEPNTGQVSTFDSCGTASTTCDRLTSSSNALDLARRKDMFNVETRYRGSFSGVGLAVEAGYMGSQHVHNGGVPGTPINYDGFNQGIFGVAVTYGGLTVGGHTMFGRFNGQWGLAPTGGPDAMAYVLGASYTTGPLIVGVQYLNYHSAGNSFQGNANVGQMYEGGVAAGGTYSLTPGVGIMLSLLYGERKESGWDLLNGGAGKLNNKVNSRLATLGSVIRW